MRRERAILQTFRNIHPSQAVFVQDEGRVAALTIKTIFIPSWSIIGRFACLEIRNINAGPLFRFPPDKLFAFAPRFTIRLRAGPIINDAAIAWPTEAPTVAEIILRLSRVRFVHAISIENARINPRAARGRAISFQFVIIRDLWTMMWLTFSISPKKNAFCVRLRFHLPAIDLREHGFHFGLAELVLRIPP